jgi:hypothetical protein
MERNKKGQFIKGSNGDTFEGFGKWYDKFGYPSIWIDNKSVMVHVFVWERANGERPKGFHIHHIDGNKSNYELNNLLCVSPSDHQKIHAGWVRNDKGEWYKKPCKDCKELLPIDRFYQRKGLTPSNRCIQCSKIYSKTLRTPEFIEKKKTYLKEYYARNKKK